MKILSLSQNMDIEELKLILLNGSIIDLRAALNDFDTDSFDSYGNNILHYYVKSNTSIQIPADTIVQLFIEFGIDISANQSKMPKRTPLHIAVIMQSKEIFNILIAKGSDLNIKDGDGKVPLSEAVFGYRGVDGYFIETLISNGAQVDVMNNYGVSPKSLAETIANYDTKKFFR